MSEDTKSTIKPQVWLRKMDLHSDGRPGKRTTTTRQLQDIVDEWADPKNELNGFQAMTRIQGLLKESESPLPDGDEPFDFEAQHPDWKEGYEIGLAGKMSCFHVTPDSTKFREGWEQGHSAWQDAMESICPGESVDVKDVQDVQTKPEEPNNNVYLDSEEPSVSSSPAELKMVFDVGENQWVVRSHDDQLDGSHTWGLIFLGDGAEGNSERWKAWEEDNYDETTDKFKIDPVMKMEEAIADCFCLEI